MLGGIITVPLMPRMTLDQFLSGILTIFGGKIWQKREILK